MILHSSFSLSEFSIPTRLQHLHNHYRTASSQSHNSDQIHLETAKFNFISPQWLLSKRKDLFCAHSRTCSGEYFYLSPAATLILKHDIQLSVPYDDEQSNHILFQKGNQKINWILPLTLCQSLNGLIINWSSSIRKRREDTNCISFISISLIGHALRGLIPYSTCYHW